jgi:GntR family transcriptional regulator
MFMRWDDPLPYSSPVPLWFQIAERLRAAIRQGEFGPGDVLPSEARINEVFGVSRATSRASLDRLEQEGLITRRSGKGSIVVSPRVDQPVNEMSGFAEDMRRRGLRPSYETRSVGLAKAPAEVAEALGVKVNSLVYRSRRLLKADDRPIGFAVSWLSPTLFRNVSPPTADDLNRGSLYEWLARECDIRIAGAREYIEAANVRANMAKELGVRSGTAVLIARRLSRSDKGQPVEYAILNFRADRYRFHLEAVRQGMFDFSKSEHASNYLR